MSDAREPLDEALARRLRRAADAASTGEQDSPLPAGAQARVLTAMLRESALIARTKRRQRARQLTAFAVAASVALGFWFSARHDDARSTVVATTPAACGLPAGLAHTQFVVAEGRQLLSLGHLGRIAASTDAELTVSSASACELVITLSRGTLAADLHDLRPARLSIRTALGDVQVRGTTFSVRVADTLEVALLKGAVDVVSRADQTKSAGEQTSSEVTRLTPGHVLQRSSRTSKAAIGSVSARDQQTIAELIDPPTPRPRPQQVEPPAETDLSASEVAAASEPSKRVRSHRPSSATELLAAAERARRAGQLTEARASYRQAGMRHGGDAEVALLRWTRLELANDQSAAALEVLALYRQRFPRGRLAAEGSWLQLRALEQAGRGADARDVARTLVERFPDSPHARAAAALPDTMKLSSLPGALAFLLSGCGLDVVSFEPLAASATVEVIVVGAIPQASIDRFGRVEPKRVDAKQLALSYPDSQVQIPADVAPIVLRWSEAMPPGKMPPMMMAAAVYELSLITSATELRLYTTEASAIVPAQPWASLLAAPGAEPLQLRLRALTAGDKPALLEAEPRTVHIAPALPAGSLYFESGPGLQRAHLADAVSADVALPELLPGCAAGHAVSRDGTRLGLACANAPGGVWSLPDLTRLSTLAADPAVTSFGAFEPGGSRFVRARDGRLELVAQSTGALLETLAPLASAAGARMAAPDWSPDGRAIVFSYWPASGGMPAPSSDDSPGAGLARLLLSTSPSDQGSFGEPQVLLDAPGAMDSVRGPQYSPDGAWIVFQTGPGMDGKMFQGALSLVAAEGGAAIPLSLGAADKPMMKGDASSPTWLPSTRPGQAWLAFSATRSDGSPQSTSSGGSLWLSAIDLSALPVPTSSPAFWLPAQPADQLARRALFAREP